MIVLDGSTLPIEHLLAVADRGEPVAPPDADRAPAPDVVTITKSIAANTLEDACSG